MEIVQARVGPTSADISQILGRIQAILGQDRTKMGRTRKQNGRSARLVAEVWVHLVKIAQSWSKSTQALKTSGEIWSNSGRNRPNSARTVPTMAEIGGLRSMLPKTWASLARIPTKLTCAARSSAKVGPQSGGVDTGVCPMLGEDKPAFRNMSALSFRNASSRKAQMSTTRAVWLLVPRSSDFLNL